LGQIISDKKFINDNIFKYEQRLESQYTIFLDNTPTFVTYYHINNVNSITDTGLLNVDNILGPNSPLKYQLIKDFPIYGIDQIKLDLAEEEEGLTSSYDGEGIILPNTVKPLPNDMFHVSYLDKDYLFMVTNIEYDTIKSNNFYRIGFTLRSLDTDEHDLLDHQVFEKYVCNFNNIGTDDKCIIEEDSYILIQELEKVCTLISDRYKTLFYSKKFNSFIFSYDNNIIYDQFLSHFIMNNHIFYKDDDYDSLVLTNEDYGIQFPILYDESIYRTIETRNIDNLEYIRYITTSITYQNSIFFYYNKLDNVRSVYFMDVGDQEYISDNIINLIQQKQIPHGTDILDELFISYFINDDNIYNIDIDRLKHFRLRYTFDIFIKIPMVLYIIRSIINNYMHV